MDIPEPALEVDGGRRGGLPLGRRGSPDAWPSVPAGPGGAPGSPLRAAGPARALGGLSCPCSNPHQPAPVLGAAGSQVSLSPATRRKLFELARAFSEKTKMRKSKRKHLLKHQSYPCPAWHWVAAPVDAKGTESCAVLPWATPSPGVGRALPRPCCLHGSLISGCHFLTPPPPSWGAGQCQPALGSEVVLPLFNFFSGIILGESLVLPSKSANLSLIS